MIESCDCSNAGAVIGGIVVAVIFIVVTALTVIVIVETLQELKRGIYVHTCTCMTII